MRKRLQHKIEQEIEKKNVHPSSLFQNNCLHKSNEKVNQGICFVAEIS